MVDLKEVLKTDCEVCIMVRKVIIVALVLLAGYYGLRWVERMRMA
jgi:hypothetical protein